MFAILFEVLLIEIQEEIRHFAGWEGGGSRVTKIVHKNFVNKLAFPTLSLSLSRSLALPRSEICDFLAGILREMLRACRCATLSLLLSRWPICRENAPRCLGASNWQVILVRNSCDFPG